MRVVGSRIRTANLATEKKRGPRRPYKPRNRRLRFGFTRVYPPKPHGIAGISRPLHRFSGEVSATADWVAVGGVWGELVCTAISLIDLEGAGNFPRIRRARHDLRERLPAFLPLSQRILCDQEQASCFDDQGTSGGQHRSPSTGGEASRCLRAQTEKREPCRSGASIRLLLPALFGGARTAWSEGSH